MVKGWKDKTPDDFRFALKFPKAITHDNGLQDVSKYLYPFFYALEPLVDKITCLLIQLPPYFSKEKGFYSFRDLVPKLDKRYRYALEVRESTWFDKEVIDFLRKNNISLVWSVRDELKTPSIVTSDHVYIRFIGDRSINERDFGKTVKDRKKEMLEYIDNMRKIQNDSNVQDISIAFNNHFAGFGPQSVNDFLRLMDKPEIRWNKDLRYSSNKSTKQTNISDFTFFTKPS